VGTLATISGVAIEPCVSSNNRLYTADMIRGAYERLSQRLKAGPDIPVSFTSHQDRQHGNVRQIAAVLREVSLTPATQIRYRMDTLDTEAGQDVTKLVSGDHPAVNAVSIVGEFLGRVRQVEVDGQQAETADGLDILGFDIVDMPGVGGARMDDVQIHGLSGERHAERRLIFESAGETAVTQVTEAPTTQPYGAVTYADPGYQQDKVKRYPLDSKAHVKAAWSYINMPKNAAKYSDEQVGRIKAKIKSAAKKLGVQIASESAPTASLFEGDAFASYGDANSYSSLIPIDPDQDGDTDFLACPTCGTIRPVTDPDLNPDIDDDNDMQAGMESAPTPPKETTVTEAANPTAVDEDQRLAAVIVAALKQSKQTTETPAVPAALTESSVADLVTKTVATAVESMKGELIEAIKGNGGGPQRQGVVPGASAGTASTTPRLEGDERLRELSKMSTESLRRNGAETIAAKVPTPASWRVVPAGTRITG
jgi:hypothetical protein